MPLWNWSFSDLNTKTKHQKRCLKTKIVGVSNTFLKFYEIDPGNFFCRRPYKLKTCQCKLFLNQLILVFSTIPKLCVLKNLSYLSILPSRGQFHKRLSTSFWCLKHQNWCFKHQKAICNFINIFRILNTKIGVWNTKIGVLNTKI